jgi:hypothetical protein
MLTSQFWKTSHPARPEAEQKILDCIHELEMERIIPDFDKLKNKRKIESDLWTLFKLIVF